MSQDFSMLIRIAQIAGVFVGFGALISATGKNGNDASQIGQIRAVVTIGLVIIVAALMPVGLGYYGMTGHILWKICSIVFLMLSWTVIVLSLQRPENRDITFKRARSHPLSAMFFWILLEAPMQLPLILTILGLFPQLEPAFYFTSLVLNVFQAAFVLAQFVYSQQQQPNISA